MRTSQYPEITLIEVYPHIEDMDGLFRYMENVPWIEAWEIPSNVVDYLYFWENSGDKLISPFLHHFLDSNHELTTAKMRQIAGIIESMLLPKWVKLFKTYDLEYNPLYNYSATKHIAESHSDTGTSSSTKGTTDTRTFNTSDARTINRDVDEQADKSAFDSSTYSPVDKVITSDDSTDTLLKTGTDTLGRTGTDTGSESKSGSYTIDETRGGAAGGYMYQDMIRKDRELWQESFFKTVFKDVDIILTLPIYPAEPHSATWFPYQGYLIL